MLLAWLAYPGSLSLSLWGWRDGQKSGALQEGLEVLGSRREGAATLKELLGSPGGSSREALQAESRTSSVFCREAQAVAVCYPSPTLDTF